MKGKKLKQKGTKRAKITVSTAGEPESKIVRETNEPIDSTPVTEPCAQVAVTLGYTMSRNYQSVRMDVHVSLPWDPLDVENGLTKAQEQADNFLSDNSDIMEKALGSL